MRWTRGLAACLVQADERDSCGRRNRVVLTPRRWCPAQCARRVVADATKLCFARIGWPKSPAHLGEHV
jgi:hypothetical protein